jgi:proton-dependent oligopeptide transporter, POT family
MTTMDAAAPKEATLFGHPRGLTHLFTTEMAERFSYYGITSFLVLFLSESLLVGGHPDHVIGYQAVKSTLEWLYGPLSTDAIAANITGLYTGLVYFTPAFGGLIADRFIGQRLAVLFGGILMAAGAFMLTQDSLFFFGLLALIIGNGEFKPNISTQVGNLYKPGDSRIDRAYSIFYVGINVGAALGPFICGGLAQGVAWHWGFFAAGVGVSLAVVWYAFALRTLPPDRITKARQSDQPVAQAKLTADDWKAIGALILLIIPSALFWMAYSQQFIAILFWAQDFTDRTFAIPGLVHFDMPSSWSQSINPIMIFAFTPFLVSLWARQARRGREPSTIFKMAIGCALQALSYVMMAGVAWIAGPHGHANWLWLIPYFAVFTLGELYVSPIGLALVSRVAPPQVLSLMMGLWFIAVFVGNTIGGRIGGFWSSMDKPSFFLMTAAIGLAGSLFILLFFRLLKPTLERRMRTDAPPVPAPHDE